MRPASRVRHRWMRQAQAGFHAAQLRTIQSPGAPVGCNSSVPGSITSVWVKELKHLETRTVPYRCVCVCKRTQLNGHRRPPPA